MNHPLPQFIVGGGERAKQVRGRAERRFEACCLHEPPPGRCFATSDLPGDTLGEVVTSTHKCGRHCGPDRPLNRKANHD
ncbi:hypothetical protein Fuma_04210 [Fuerstiella marisgermanici]|uniref:Uncharacterized protein n=1 Tax=Fuerstiella marisgermanici TaxID=1891926 RepID=A0A1P8WKJ5_9PLAN|nr:hypothetical protein Fuma_04210 [Fuerstiella marisgermanici]